MARHLGLEGRHLDRGHEAIAPEQRHVPGYARGEERLLLLLHRQHPQIEERAPQHRVEEALSVSTRIPVLSSPWCTRRSVSTPAPWAAPGRGSSAPPRVSVSSTVTVSSQRACGFKTRWKRAPCWSCWSGFWLNRIFVRRWWPSAPSYWKVSVEPLQRGGWSVPRFPGAAPRTWNMSAKSAP